MGSVPRPLLALLVATVAGFALWTTMVKKSLTGTSAGGGSTQSYASAVAKAHQAVAIENAATAAHGGEAASAAPATGAAVSHAAATASTASHTAAPATATPSRATPPATSSKASPSLATARTPLEQALAAHKVVVVLFYNPPGADDQAVKQELGALPTHAGAVFKQAVPISQIADYAYLTDIVPVDSAPTLLMIGRSGAARTISGFADGFEIAQDVSQLLKP